MSDDIRTGRKARKILTIMAAVFAVAMMLAVPLVVAVDSEADFTKDEKGFCVTYTNPTDTQVPAEYKMVNDYVEQTFDIVQKRDAVSVTLHDLFVLEPRPGRGDAWDLLLGRDLNTRYQIRIERNPCFGFDEEIATAATMLGEIRTAYAPFRKTYGDGEVPPPRHSSSSNRPGPCC